MKTEKRMINGELVTVNIYNEMESIAHEAMEKRETEERRNREHADRVAATLAKDHEFINSIGKSIASEQMLTRNMAAEIVGAMALRSDLLKELAYYIVKEMEIE